MNSLKPSSRLTIIFILAVVLSGSILTYFSINNISNLKELTEKRILEEQRELFMRVSDEIRNNIEKVTAGLSDETIKHGKMLDSLLKRAHESEFIIQPFIMKDDGQFMYPNFAGIPEDQPLKNLSNRYVSALIAGEKAEFIEKKFIKAKDFYLSCLNYSTFKSDSVKALNALGRISVKLIETGDAIKYYNLIISDFPRVNDGNGIPYIYYALPQLLKTTGTGNRDKILTTIISCLEKMEAGLIPINYNTEELLVSVKDWLKENTFSDKEKSSEISDLIFSIGKQNQFVGKYGNELSEVVKKEHPDNTFITGNDFKVIGSVSGNNQEFFLFKTIFENSAGFLIDFHKLLDTISKTDLQSGLEFDYEIEFPAEYRSNTSGDKLVYISQLTPLFPYQLIEIKLKDENLIKDLIERRAWIYGVAFAMLLVAMSLGVVLILRDIAREKKLARLRSDFISNVTHELKTPLTSIRMYAESLLMGRVISDTAQREYLSVVVNEADRLKRMINNILEFSKMEKGKPEYYFVSSNLATIILSAIKEMNYWLEKEKFDIVRELDESIYAEADPEKLMQVIENLLSNAIKYSPGIKKIFIRLFRNPAHICIEVEDRGIGIPADKISRIFEPFYRIEQNEGVSGTGLGLTVVKEIIEAHNGNVSVTSESGKGSKFMITLPLSGNSN